MDQNSALRNDAQASPAPVIRDTDSSPRLVKPVPNTSPPEIPPYLQEIYYWAYLNPRNVKLLDHEFVVKTILWQQHNKLKNAAISEIKPGQKMLQAACVYGDISAKLAEAVGVDGSLEIADVAAVQVENARRKLKNYPQVTVHHANIMQFDRYAFELVCCYFLLHELSDNHKSDTVNALLDKVEPGGKVVFVDYHKPHWAHPLKAITSFIFDTLEPFAKGLWRKEIVAYADRPEEFNWRKETYFGGLFQKVVAERKTSN
jgi:ubiquinone/menaquinone biosynthesis C-methylase UbiE